MINLRKYGKEPFTIAVIHGGPGAAGEMVPVAEELSSKWGVLEPLQRADSLEGQVQELKRILKKNGDLPVILIGSSWGAMLSFIFAARCRPFVKKLILVGSGVYEEKYAINIMKTRVSRLNEEEILIMHELAEGLKDPSVKNKNDIFAQLGKLISHADYYDPIPYETETIEYDYNIYQKVWEDASKLRASGELLELGEKIQCPVLAIHGEYDPHPSEGIIHPLSRIIKDFRFVLLKHCGHHPWVEAEAKEKFYDILKGELERAD